VIVTLYRGALPQLPAFMGSPCDDELEMQIGASAFTGLSGSQETTLAITARLDRNLHRRSGPGRDQRAWVEWR
jgi:hypothetical protein